LKSIRSDQRRHADEMARLLIAANGLDSMIPHDPGNSIAADLLARFTQVEDDSRTSVDPTARRIRLLDEFEQSFVFNRSIRQWPMDQRVEAASGDSKDPTPRLHREAIALSMDEGVLYSVSLAKYAAAFFRISRSS
jgi:hypothetical protein